jgi:Uma2 family endonuclease
MRSAAPRPWIDYATYLTFERDADQKHEWFDGEIFAMAGGTIEHAQLAAAVGAELRAIATPCGCRVFSSDLKIRVLATGLATYPDAAVVCGAIERDPDNRHAATNPSILVEVLSDGTEAYDRGQKFANYRAIPSLRDYVVVSQYEPRIEVHSRDASGLWVLREARSGGGVPLSALGGGTLEVDRVYQGVELTATPRGPR